MSIVINNESIENLLKAREKFDEYLELKKDNPDSRSLKQNMLFELAKLGFLIITILNTEVHRTMFMNLIDVIG